MINLILIFSVGSLSPGAAAGITSAVFILLFAAMTAYFLLYEPSTSGGGGFANPSA